MAPSLMVQVKWTNTVVKLQDRTCLLLDDYVNQFAFISSYSIRDYEALNTNMLGPRSSALHFTSNSCAYLFTGGQGRF